MHLPPRHGARAERGLPDPDKSAHAPPAQIHAAAQRSMRRAEEVEGIVVVVVVAAAVGRWPRRPPLCSSPVAVDHSDLTIVSHLTASW